MVDVPRSVKPAKAARAIRAGALTLGLFAAVAIARLKPGPPRIDATSIQTDTVRRGVLLREVRAAGSLAPEAVVLIAALSAGRIDRVHVRPGARVRAGTLLLETTNPDIRLELLEAERELAVAEGALVALKASLATQRLGQAAVVAAVRTQQREAERQATVHTELLKLQAVAPLEAARSQDQAEELAHRLEMEGDRLAILSDAALAQTRVQRAEIERLRAIVAFHRARTDALSVRATAEGVVQDIPSETGQWVNVGQTLVKMYSGDRLKAVLRVPEVEATDVAPGQAVVIDTRNGVVRGSVVRVSPAVQGGVVPVDVALPDSLPRGARPDLSVDGRIEVERVPDALYVARTPDARAFAPIVLYKVNPEQREAHRAPVRVGRVSSESMEIVSGLRQGDVVITSTLDGRADRLRLDH